MSKVVLEAPGAIRILQALRQRTRGGAVERPLKSYTTIKEDAYLGDPSLAKHLRKLLARGLIERDSNTRAYRITRSGDDELTRLELAEQMRDDVLGPLLDSPAMQTDGVLIIAINEITDRRLQERIKALTKELARKKLLIDTFRIGGHKGA
jgi:DNA-binding PadR family transcriptional regulator